jgi:hypothetical protein
MDPEAVWGAKDEGEKDNVMQFLKAVKFIKNWCEGEVFFGDNE